MSEPLPAKRCARCQIEKPLTDFHRQPTGSMGRHSWCRKCANAYARANKVKVRKPGQRARWSRMTRYRLTEDQYQEMVARQAGLCLICGREMKHPRIDHCHRTGKVRGLLCHRCNLLLAGVEDPVFLKAATAYLEEHND